MGSECQHLWVYDHKDFMDIFVRCLKCGAVRLANGGEKVSLVANVTAMELNIRHDDKDGDV